MSNWTQADLDNLKSLQQRAPSVATAPKPKQLVQARIRLPRGMNKVEAAYHAHLAMRQRLGEVLWHRFEGITLKLGDDCRFTADFAVLLPNGSLELHDTKALWKGRAKPHIEDDALVKLRTAAEMYPFRVKAVWAEENGDWGEREF